MVKGDIFHLDAMAKVRVHDALSNPRLPSQKDAKKLGCWAHFGKATFLFNSPPHPFQVTISLVCRSIQSISPLS